MLACQDRSAATVTQCLLHGVVLRDGCPLHIHSDAAKEFISKAMVRLCSLLGCDKTTTLAHHPTGNATIERLWQWIASCLRQMTKEQYEHWEKYVRLMEHVWNTTEHSVLKCSPFEAAHGLPARSVQDTWIEESGDQPTDLMTQDGIEAMRVTAKAFEKQIQNVRQEAAREAAKYNSKGPKRMYKVGDQVSFYLPPSEKEAKDMGRKPKHMLQYKGPGIITKILSRTTYQLEYEGRTYYRCFSELRLYKSNSLPMDLPVANDTRMQERKVIVGNFVALCNTDDPEDDHFHLCRVLAIEDEKAILLNYSTSTRNLKLAKFGVLYQKRSTQQYTLEPPGKKAREQEVIDQVPLEDANSFIDHYDVKITKAMRISAKSIKQLTKLGLRHHVLGKTFP